MRLVFVLFIAVGLGSSAYGVSFIGGIDEILNYQSLIPCKAASKDQACFATNGVMGIALDTASQAGLNIKQIEITKNNNKVFVHTKNYGTCLVDLKQDQLAGVDFKCSSQGLSEDQLKKVDRTFTLIKEDTDQYTLLENPNPTRARR